MMMMTMMVELGLHQEWALDRVRFYFIYLFIYLLTICNKTLKTYFDGGVLNAETVQPVQAWKKGR